VTDHYKALGVEPDATQIEIKSAWRCMQVKWHPDRCKAPDAAERFAAASTAYDVLGDPEARRAYDLKRIGAATVARGDEVAAELARRRLGRDLTARERTGVSWLWAAAKIAGDKLS
jgi:curved DNA-binding protein CbpA